MTIEIVHLPIENVMFIVMLVYQRVQVVFSLALTHMLFTPHVVRARL